jgi:hypothetical protein
LVGIVQIPFPLSGIDGRDRQQTGGRQEAAQGFPMKALRASGEPTAIVFILHGLFAYWFLVVTLLRRFDELSGYVSIH